MIHNLDILVVSVEKKTGLAWPIFSRILTLVVDQIQIRQWKIESQAQCTLENPMHKIGFFLESLGHPGN